MAAEKGYDALVRELLARGASVDVRDKVTRGRRLCSMPEPLADTPNKTSSTVTELGAEQWICPASHACILNSMAVINACSSRASFHKVAMHACYHDLIWLSMSWLHMPAHACMRTQEGRTPLHYACKAGSTETATALLRARANRNVRDNVREMLVPTRDRAIVFRHWYGTFQS